jgi:hypothetical protein
MPTRDERARQIQDSIRQVLLHDWDPFGAGDGSTTPQDEYNDYIAGVYRLVFSGASVETIAAHLAGIEKGLFVGSPERANHLLHVARNLHRLDVRLGAVDDSA